MNKVNQSVIETLDKARGETVLTVYAPTHKISTPPNIQEDQTRLKNLMRAGFEQWQAKTNSKQPAIARQQLEKLLLDENFWNETTETLAIFASKDGVSIYHLPIECQEYVCVDTTYDITPLRMVMALNQPYYLFALAMHDSKLFRGDMYGLKPVSIDFPASPEDALNIDEMFSGSNTIRGISTQGGGNDKLSTHGQGDSNHAGQEERLKYFRILDDMIMRAKDIDARRPVVIAATDSEASDYKNISKLPYLIETHVQGNHTMTPQVELHDLAWKIVESEVTDKKITTLIERFNELKGTQKASHDMTEIMDAAKIGRVETLLAGGLPVTNDSVNDTTNANAPIIRLEDLYSQTGIKQLIDDVIAQGGSVVGVDPDRLGAPILAGALYRY